MRPTADRIEQQQRARDHLLSFLSNPDSPLWVPRNRYAKLCGFKDAKEIYMLFSPEELLEIELEALKQRRKHSVRDLDRIDKAMIKKARGGSVAAARLMYAKLEGWSESLLRPPGEEGKNQLEQLCEIISQGPLKKGEADDKDKE